MAYSALPTKNAGDTITLANYTAIKDNFEAGVPDLYTTKGDIVSASAADTGARLAIGADDSTLVADASAGGNLAWQIQPAARVWNNGNIDPATSSWVTLTFDSERFDTDTVHSTVANTSRLTIPTNGDGLYLIGGQVNFDASGTTTGERAMGVRILLNGATVLAENLDVHSSVSGGSDLDVQIVTLYSLAATNYVELQVYTVLDVDVQLVANTSPEFWCIWQRRA